MLHFQTRVSTSYGHPQPRLRISQALADLATEGADGRCGPGLKECLNTCIDEAATCCGGSDPDSPVICQGEMSGCSHAVNAHGVECACPPGKRECNGGCIDAHLECCESAPTPLGCAVGFTCERGSKGYTCACDGKLCGGSCIPTDATCCDTTRGVYCEGNRACQRDASEPSGYSCSAPRGACEYVETVTTGCGSNRTETTCIPGLFTATECANLQDDDAVCAGGCCWSYRYSQFRLVTFCN